MACNPAQLTYNQFGPLLSQHVKTILESGLLLDEDYEVLLNASNFKIYPTKSFSIPFRLIAGTLTTLGSVFIARKYCRPIIALPTVGITIILFYFERSAAWKKKRREAIIKHIVKSYIQLRKLNTAIIRYMKMRKEPKSKENEAFSAFNENIKDFVAFFISQNVICFKFCLEQLKYFASITKDLSDDYKGLKDLDVESVLVTENINSENYDLLITKVQDVYTFLTSKYLNYLGITFCKNLTNNNSSEMETLLDEKLPFVTAYLDQLYLLVEKEFNNLRYCASKKLEIDMINRSCFARQLSGKLQQTLVGAVNNLSLIMEKSRFVLGKVENMESDKDFEKFESALSDLRDHALATYESLDILCKMYGIVSNARQLENAQSVDGLSKKNYTEEQNSLPTVSYDDSSEALEENYELYIADNDELAIAEPKERYEDQSAVYLSLMLKELRQSLKQHERFIAARSKRGIKEDDDEEVINKKQTIVPKFDLGAFKIDDKRKQKEVGLNNELPPIPPPRPSKNVGPLPPPPPPLPPPDVILHNTHQINEEVDSSRTLFDSIRTLSSQLKVEEDVFGDECDSESD